MGVFNKKRGCQHLNFGCQHPKKEEVTPMMHIAQQGALHWYKGVSGVRKDICVFAVTQKSNPPGGL